MEKVKRLLRRILWQLFRILPIQKNKIVFVSYYGRGYSDNPKYIAEQLLADGMKMKYVWVVSGKEQKEFPEQFITTQMNSVSYIYHMSTAKFWVDNARKYYCVKKKGQLYIQTWHGGFGLKRIEKEVEDKLSPAYVRMAKRDAKQIDLMISNSKTLSDLYRSAFWYETGEILECGLPRNDRLFNYTEQDANKIREKLKLPENVKVCLYAPTFRESRALDIYNMDYYLCAKELEKKFGGKWIILLRLHPNIFKLSQTIQFDEKVVFNASFYEDIQELYMISDLAITDYSSIMFDFMLTGKPCLMYASDVAEYKKDRNFFVPLEELPFPLAEDNQQLAENIEKFDLETYSSSVEKFMKKHKFCETGEASKRVAEWIEKR